MSGGTIIDYLRHASAPFIFSAPILPIAIGGTQETLVVAKRVYEAGVFTNPFIPPGVPEGEGLLRTSFTATHTPALIDEAATVLQSELRNSSTSKRRR